MSLKSRYALVFGVLGFIVVVYFSVGKLYKAKQQEEAHRVVESAGDVFERPHAPVLGPVGAPVTLVEFLDPECESCRALYPVVKQILKEHEGKVRLVIRYVPFHQNSQFAIHILEAARLQNKYWETLEVLFKYQPLWGDHHHPKPERLWEFLPEAGVDIQKLKADLRAPATVEKIRVDIEDARALQVKATPTFFVNKKPLLDFGPEPLRALVREALQQSGDL